MTPTPKDEAKRLIKLFKASIQESDFHIPEFISGVSMRDSDNYKPILDQETLDLAREQALLCVEEMIKEHTHKYPIGWNNLRKKHWQQVKTEIENYK